MSSIRIKTIVYIAKSFMNIVFFILYKLILCNIESTFHQIKSSDIKTLSNALSLLIPHLVSYSRELKCNSLLFVSKIACHRRQIIIELGG